MYRLGKSLVFIDLRKASAIFKGEKEKSNERKYQNESRLKKPRKGSPRHTGSN